jgi:hypothetical protein
VRTLKRAVAVSCAAALAVPLWAVPASAETVTEAPGSAAYFNAAGTSQPEQSPIKPPNPIASVDGVAPGNLGVAARAGAEDKVSFLFFSLSTVPVDATITRAVLTVPLAPADNGNVRMSAAPEKVVACAPQGSAFTDEDGEALVSAPERKCDIFKASGAAAGDAAYTFDITALAASWLTSNEGVALTRDPARQDTFQVVFTRDATLAVEFTAPPAIDTDTGSGLGGSASTADSFPTTTDSGTASFDAGGFDSGSFSAEIPGSSLSAATAPLDGGALPAGPEPQAVTDQPAVAAAPAAAGGPIELLSPTPAFWLAVLFLAGMLGFLGLVMGDRTAPATGVDSRPSRLTRALSAPAGSRPSLLGPRSS